MKKISRFDLAMIIAFVVVALAGGGSAYYFSAYVLATAQSDVQAANSDFQKNTAQMVFLPTGPNVKILQSNIELMKAQIDPLEKNIFRAPGNKLPGVANEDSVAWKQDLDKKVADLNAAARGHGVQVPDNYYYSFSRYLGPAPSEGTTAVLSKQLLAIEEMATILIEAPVNGIRSIQRTAEEDAGGPAPGGGDFIAGHSVQSAGGIYTAYPFEIEFDTTPEAFRKVVNRLMQSPYIFVIRSVSVLNSQPASPQLGDLDKIAGTPSSASVTDSPGAVAAAKSTVGPQYLFGNETLDVRVRIDLIEWQGLPGGAANPLAPTGN